MREHTPRANDANADATLAYLRWWLIVLSQHRTTTTFSLLMGRLSIGFDELRSALHRIAAECHSLHEPLLTSLVVGSRTGCSLKTIRRRYRTYDDVTEQQRCSAHWATQPAAMPLPPTNVDVQAAAKSFALKASRPSQSAFRAAVYASCGGACVVSGCDVPEALEAAHLVGRLWSRGFNGGEDGILLRRDLHALYDSGLLSFDVYGRVRLSKVVQPHYSVYDGAQARLPPALGRSLTKGPRRVGQSFRRH